MDTEEFDHVAEYVPEVFSSIINGNLLYGILVSKREVILLDLNLPNASKLNESSY